jgi:hypothetical protein
LPYAPRAFAVSWRCNLAALASWLCNVFAMPLLECACHGLRPFLRSPSSHSPSRRRTCRVPCNLFRPRSPPHAERCKRCPVSDGPVASKTSRLVSSRSCVFICKLLDKLVPTYPTNTAYLQTPIFETPSRCHRGHAFAPRPPRRFQGGS